MQILVGDVGGTNTRLALFDGDGNLQARATARNDDHPALWPIVQGFLGTHSARPDAACLGVAAPVRGERVTFTNRDWTLDAPELSARLGAPLTLINDLHAQALACTRLSRTDFAPLDDLAPNPKAPMAILGAGTGLGEAVVVPGPLGPIALAGEGGHARFAPRDAREMGLAQALAAKYGPHVSVERVVSGQGLVDTYDHLRGAADRWPEMQAPGADVAALISKRALADTCPHSVAALDIFCGVFADEAANLALKINAGVVYLVGGITPRILPFLRPRFRAAFTAKGRFEGWLKQVPVRVVTHPDPGLLGARIAAEALVGRGP